jgi:hypothetical protein
VWNRQTPDPDFDRWYVGMKSDASGNLSFEYGKFGVPLDATNPNPNANLPVKLGDADSGTYNVATGVATIVLSNSKAENIGAGTSMAGINVRTYFARPDSGPKTQSTASDITGDGSYTLSGNNACCNTPVPLLGVSSRKTHGDAGTFDIGLPLTGNPGVECRTGGSNGDFTLVFTFANPITAVSNAQITSGPGHVTTRSSGTDPHEYIVNVTGVTNAQRVTVTLTGISDTAGNTTSSLAVTMGVLLGDVNGDGFVLSGDYTSTRQRSGTHLDGSTFKYDVNTDGFILSGDYTIVRQQSGTQLP